MQGGVLAYAGGVATALQARGLVQPGAWPQAADAAVRVLWIAGLYLIVWSMPNTQQIFAEYRPALGEVLRSPLTWLRWRPNPRWAIVMGCATMLAALAIGGTGEFLYFQF